MTDEALRRSARAAAATDDVAARARLLGDELRAGLRSRGDVELLAYLADPGALLLLDEPAPDLSGEDGPVLWMRGFLAWGPEVLLRAVVAWLWRCAEDPPGSVDDSDRIVLEAASLWWTDPSRGAEALRRAPQRSNGQPGLYLRLVTQHAEAATDHVLSVIDYGVRCESAPAPAVVAPRLAGWLESRRTFARSLGEGPAWRRAIDGITPPSRRQLVAALRQGSRVSVLFRRERVEFEPRIVEFDRVVGTLIRPGASARPEIVLSGTDLDALVLPPP